MKIYEKLLRIQDKLVCNKGQYNSFGNYSYRSCEDILEAIKPLLTEMNIVINLSDTLEYIGERHYVKATATLIDIESGDSINSTAYAREEETKKGMDASQITGASSSYARKYALNGLLAIDDVKDSDTTNTHEKEPQNQGNNTSKQSSQTNYPTKPITVEIPPENEPTQVCEQCKTKITDKVAKYSKDKFGKVLCFSCQKKNNEEQDGLPF